MVWLIIVIIILVCILLWLFMIKPAKRNSDFVHILGGHFVAHRGLYDNENCIPENSLMAFKRALDSNYPIELDVQMTADKKLIVFHDLVLTRMCGSGCAVKECTYKELHSFLLLGSNERIPLLEDVLKLVRGQVSLIIEIKEDSKWREISERLVALLDKYKGVYTIQSFKVRILRWFKKNKPDIIRGYLYTNFLRDYPEENCFKNFVKKNFLTNFLTKPDYINCNILDYNLNSYKIVRKLFKPIVLGWTVKTEDDMNKVKEQFDVLICNNLESKK